jgi:hypothetical protein
MIRIIDCSRVGQECRVGGSAAYEPTVGLMGHLRIC